MGQTDAPPLGAPAAILSDVSLKPEALFGPKTSAPPTKHPRKRPKRDEDAPTPSSDPVIPALPPSGSATLTHP